MTIFSVLYSINEKNLLLVTYLSSTCMLIIFQILHIGSVLCVGLAATVAILVNGIWQMKTGDVQKSQRMMRYRVMAQGFTILALVGGILLGAQKATSTKE